MTEKEFLDTLCIRFMALDHDWDFGAEIDKEVRDIMELCKAYLEERCEVENGEQRDSYLPKRCPHSLP